MSKDAYSEAVHSLPCIICHFKLGQKVYGVHAHHLGDASDRDDFNLAPLCYDHHLGPAGIHGLQRRGFHRVWKTTDQQLTAWTNQLLWKQR